MKIFESTGCHNCVLAAFDGNAKDTCALDNNVRNHDNINSQTFNKSCPLKYFGGKIEVVAVEDIEG
jgi:hypothetical protein